MQLEARVRALETELDDLTNVVNHNARALDSLKDTVNHNAEVANWNNMFR